MNYRTGTIIELEGVAHTIVGKVRKHPSGASGWLRATAADGTTRLISPKVKPRILATGGPVVADKAKAAARERARLERVGKLQAITDKPTKFIPPFSEGDRVTIGKGSKVYTITSMSDDKARLVPEDGTGSTRYGVSVATLGGVR
jgi:hypothetical protein